MKIISVVGLPEDHPDKSNAENPLPWKWGEEDFRGWVHEVFLEGYKRDVSFPTLNEAIEIVENHGYTVSVKAVKGRPKWMKRVRRS